MSLLDLIDEKRPEILRLAAKHGAKDLRLFGSVARGEEHEGSDVDLLASVQSFGEYVQLQEELEQLLGVHVDIVEKVHPFIREQVLSDAIPLEAPNFREQAVLQSQRPRPAMDRNKLHIVRIRDSIAKVERYAAITHEQFVESDRDQDAIIRQLTNIGEACRAISRDFRKQHPEIEWQKIIGFRNIAVHVYYAIDLEQVWNIAKNDVPALKAELEKLI